MIKNTDARNVVSQDLAERMGFKPEYSGFGDGLELWSRRLSFDSDGVETMKRLLNALGISEFTSWSRSPSGKFGTVRITVKPTPQPKKPQEDYIMPQQQNPFAGKKSVIKLSESQLRNLVAESVKKVLAERYLEPGTADYDTDRIAQKLK